MVTNGAVFVFSAGINCCGMWLSVGCSLRGDSAVTSFVLVASAVPSSEQLHVPGGNSLPGSGSSAEPALRVQRIFSLGAAFLQPVLGSGVPSRGCVGGLGSGGAQIHPNSEPGGVFPPPSVPPPCPGVLGEVWALPGSPQPLQSLIPGGTKAVGMGWVWGRDGAGAAGGAGNQQGAEQGKWHWLGLRFRITTDGRDGVIEQHFLCAASP